MLLLTLYDLKPASLLGGLNTSKDTYVYKETFSPVVKCPTFRMMLVLAAVHDWEIEDVKTAFLNPRLNGEVYMGLPEGCEVHVKVFRLNARLKGLKQAPRECYTDINTYLVKSI